MSGLPSPGPRPTWFAWAIGIVSSIITIGTAAAAFSGHLGRGYVLTLFMLFIASFTAIVLYLLRTFSHNISEFKSSLDTLNDEVQHVRDSHRVVSRMLELAREINEEVSEFRHVPSARDVTTFARNAVRSMAKTFSDSTGYTCRVCVKQVKSDESSELWVEAIARSDRSVEADIGVRHQIKDNTDFDVLRTHREAVWFCPDIWAYSNYRTTSHMPTYRSTIVWPVMTRVAEQNAPAAGFAPIVAYLCLDSDQPDMFDFEEHVPLGWVVSDALARLFEAQKSIWVT